MQSVWKERGMIQWVGNMNPNEKGFSLIEILITLAVFSIGMLAIGGLQASSISGSTRANRLTRAGAFAASKIEYLKEEDWNDVNAVSIKPDGGFWYKMVVEADTPLQPLAVTPGGAAGPYQRSKIVTVIVYGDAGGEDEIVRYRFIKVRVI